MILAGVSIAILTGENGILNKATIAKVNTQKATAKEKIQVALMGSYGIDGKIDIEELNNNLKNVEGLTSGLPIEKLPATVRVDGYEATISKNGKVSMEENGNGEVENTPIPPEEEKIGISASDIADSEDKREYYGAIVTGYECPNSEGVANWKIFYADENNIYLIADSYIHGDYCPSSANYKITRNSTYRLSMHQVIMDYPNGSAHIIDSKIKALNNDYFNGKGYSSSNMNMKEVAYMLDTNVWSVYKGEKADYAIGGPTIELLFRSYNEKYGTNYQAQAINATGYQISKDGGTSWATSYEEILDSTDPLYLASSIDSVRHMWIASPSSRAKDSLLLTSLQIGGIYSLYYTSDIEFSGFRPLVCLSSGVQLEKIEDGTYVIK